MYRHPTTRARYAPRYARAGLPLQGIPIQCRHGTQAQWTGTQWICGCATPQPPAVPPSHPFPVDPGPPAFGQMQIPGPPDYLLNWQASSWNPETGKMQIGAPPDYLLNWQVAAQTPGAPPPPYPPSPDYVRDNLQDLLMHFPTGVAPSIDQYDPPTIAAQPSPPDTPAPQFVPDIPEGLGAPAPPPEAAPGPASDPYYDPCAPCGPAEELQAQVDATYCYR